MYNIELCLFCFTSDIFFLLHSTKSDGKLTSLDQYIKRMKSGQKDIFYITGTTKEQLEKSPFLERLIKKNYEVELNFYLQYSNSLLFIFLTCTPNKSIIFFNIIYSLLFPCTTFEYGAN